VKNTKKSTCIQLINESIEKAQKLIDECEFNVVKTSQSASSSSSSSSLLDIENLIKHISTNQNSMIQCFDSIESLNTNYKLLISNIYSNKLTSLKYYIKSEKYVLKNPKISMICIENSFKMIHLLQDSNKNHIFSKFLFCCPKPFKKRLETANENKKSDFIELDLIKYFFVMKLINRCSKTNNLCFNKESLEILSNHCETYNNLCSNHEIDKPFLGYHIYIYQY
jgi:hypothetical protein